MSNLSHVRSKIALIGSLVPEAWDALHPSGSAFISDHFIELMVAETVRDASTHISDKKLAKAARHLSATMAGIATAGLVNGWEDGDPICPPYPWERFPKGPVFGPFPLPWPEPWPGPVYSMDGGIVLQPVAQLTQLELSSALVQLSSLTYNAEANKGLVTIAGDIARGISSKLGDEVDPCGTVPRKLKKRPHVGPGPLTQAGALAGIGN